MEKIGIFYPASDSINLTFLDAAHQIGEWMGRNGKTLIYGGTNLGLVECVAKAVKESGGRVIGVVPSKLEENNKVSTYLDEMIRTCNLNDREDIILQQSGVLVTLPGGIDTLGEVFHVMTAASIGCYQKKATFYNANGLYSPLLAVFSELQARGLTRRSLSSYYEVANAFNELTTKI